MERTCSVEGCERKHERHGFCRGHYDRVRRNGSPGPAEFETKFHRRDKSVRDEHDRKLCIQCGEWKPEAEFYKNHQCSDGFLPYCASCCSDRVMRQRTGMTLAEVLAIVARQGGCAACGCAEPQGRKYWMVDHDHRCCPGVYHCGRCIRGVLCGHCNSALGFVHDDPATLRALAAYLERTAS